MRALPMICVALVALACAATTARAATYVVNSTVDLPDGDPTDGACASSPPPAPVCTLRAAVMQANANPGQDSISLPPGTYTLTRVGYDSTASLGDLDITEGVTITGTGASSSVIIDANGAVTFDRAFEVISGGGLSLYNLTIKNGNTPGYGGAIYAKSGLYLEGVNVVDNTAALDGGGIYAVASVALKQSAVQGNTTHGNGGGIQIGDGSSVINFNSEHSVVAFNQALGDSGLGGGIGAYSAAVVVQASSVHDNAGGQGGGLYYTDATNLTSLKIVDSQFDHNMASSDGGGAFIISFNDTITRSTFTRNSATGDGGGIFAAQGPHLLTDVGVGANTSTSFGGGIMLISGHFDLVRGQVTGNSAMVGGGIGSVGSLAVTDSSVYANHAANDGGGVYTGGKFNATSSAIYRNSAQRGGGLFVDGTNVTAIDNSIVEGNGARSYGGGVFIDTSVTLKLDSATITGNSARTGYPAAGSGGGIYVTSPAVATATGTVMAYNTNSPVALTANDCSGALNLGGYNFISSNGGCTVSVLGGASGNSIGGTYPNNIDPLLSGFQPLYDPALPAMPNASAKFGRVPLAGSPLIDAGDPAGPQTGDGIYLLWDEIGQFRAINARSDIGAIEYGAAIDWIFLDKLGG